MASTGATRPRIAPPPPPPSGILFFVHGANETSEGLARNVARIEDQVRRRGWDVRVVAPEWRRRSGLRVGNWRKALYRGARPAAISLSNVPRGVGRAAVLKLVTNYFEGRREMLLDTVGAQMLADVIGYHEHRDSRPDGAERWHRRRLWSERCRVVCSTIAAQCVRLLHAHGA